MDQRTVLSNRKEWNHSVRAAWGALIAFLENHTHSQPKEELVAKG